MREALIRALLPLLWSVTMFCSWQLAAYNAPADMLPVTTELADPAPEVTIEIEPTVTDTNAKTAERRHFNTPSAERPNSGMALSKIVISLALVVTLVFILGWLFKKLTLRLPGSRQIKVICSLPLGAKERLLVIEMQGKQRVLGVTAHSINMLFELENPLPEEKLASDFHTQLQSLLKK